LVPFHFSRRYLATPQQIYDEVRSACPRTVVPKSAGLFEAHAAAFAHAALELD